MPKPMKFTSNTGPMKKRGPYVHRKAEKIEWDYKLLHEHLYAMRVAISWGAQGQGNWAKEWENYGKQMLSLAKGGRYKSNKPPVRPTCNSKNQFLKGPYTRPGHLQCAGR